MKPTFEKSVDTQKLAKFFAAMAPDQFVSYAELNAMLPGCNLQNGDRHTLDSARRSVLRENSVVIGTVIGKGVKRLTDEEITDLPEGAIAHIRRATDKTGKKLL